MTTHVVGKSKIRIDVEGCIDCGTYWSSGWYYARTVIITIGKKEHQIDVSRCADCEDKSSDVGKAAS